MQTGIFAPPKTPSPTSPPDNYQTRTSQKQGNLQRNRWDAARPQLRMRKSGFRQDRKEVIEHMKDFFENEHVDIALEEGRERGT